MKVLITGADGFIAKNLRSYLAERADVHVLTYARTDSSELLSQRVNDADFIFHLAGVNRPQDPAEFEVGNASLTLQLCQAIRASGRKIPVVFSSSTQASAVNPYGQSKQAAEEALFELGKQYGSPIHVFRLPNVFGKWSRPNYNSAVATFCHNIARGQPIHIHDASARLTLAYVDDVVERFVQLMDGALPAIDGEGFEMLAPLYTLTVGELAEQIQAFHRSRDTLVTERVGQGLVRALYATYVSFLPVEAFTYELPQYKDVRGVFVEMLKTPDCGQFSYFTAHAGVTRGGHYHHSKTEKFLVIKGQALFRFRHILTGETHELITRGETAQVVETVPGWAHDITNIGSDEMVVMLWANERFDRKRPDTYSCPVQVGVHE